VNVLDLFSGIGGFSLGFERAGMRTVAFCEIDRFCQAVLRKHWPSVPLHHDITKLRGADVGPVDVICGGFPCQDVSVAGKRAGMDGARSGLWTEYARIVGELRPRYVIVENTPGLLSLGMGDVLGDLAALGYDAEWEIIPASALGASHRRERVWIVAYPHGSGLQERSVFSRISSAAGRHDNGKDAPLGSWWPPEPDLVRVADGLSLRVDRVRSLGNSVVPPIPEIIGRAIMSTVTFP
jgi:DNA (cytosine-5)-methyltransferase 1